MQKVITLTLVPQLRPAAKPYEVRDTRHSGLLIRGHPTGVKTSHLEHARAKRIKLGRSDASTPEQARTRAREILAAVYAGQDPAAEKRRQKVETFGDLIDKE